MIREGTKVKWDWGNGEAKGDVEEVFHREVTRTLKGEEVTRKGSDENPAYLIKQDDGDKVLKLNSEVERA